jgi:undecaprenyl-diphosphatase
MQSSSSFSAESVFSSVRVVTLELIAGAFAVAGSHWRKGAVVIVLVGLVLWAMLPREMMWLAFVQGDKTPALNHLAKFLSAWGDFFPGTLIVSAFLGTCGWITGKSRLQQAAYACLLAAALGGLSTDVLKIGFGRARPNSGIADGLYGPSFRAKLHGFPSGHTTAAMATGISVAVVAPELAVPAIAYGAGVGWSRMYLNWHRPTDVVAGAMVGSMFGLAFGVAARKRVGL